MVSNNNRRAFDDNDDFDISIKKKPGGSKALIALLAVGAGLIVLACLVTAIIVAVMSDENARTAAKLPGSWKGRFVVAGRAFDTIYTFNKDGTMREESFDLQGRRINIANGRWRVRDGEVEIDWERGGFENATVVWIDDKSMNYVIVDHSDVIQIGSSTTFRRQ